MSTEQEHPSAQQAEAADTPQQQEQPQAHDAHAGQGSDSAMKQLRVWEQHRARLEGGKQREGPD